MRCSRFVGGSRTHLFGMDTEHSSTGNPGAWSRCRCSTSAARRVRAFHLHVYDWRTRGLRSARVSLREAPEVCALGRADLDRAATRPRATCAGGRAVTMSRQRLTIGTFGEIGYLVSPNGRVVARPLPRLGREDPARPATGDTRKSAERALKAKARRPEPLPTVLGAHA